MSSSPSSPATPGAKTHGKNAFFFIIVTVFIDMMAFAVIMPSMPFLMAELLNGKDVLVHAKDLAAAGDRTLLEGLLSDAAPWGGYITTVYAIMNFLSAQILGGLSDRFGRRPVLLLWASSGRACRSSWPPASPPLTLSMAGSCCRKHCRRRGGGPSRWRAPIPSAR